MRRIRGSLITSHAVREKTARMWRWIVVGGPTQVVSISSSSENNRSRAAVLVGDRRAVARRLQSLDRSAQLRRGASTPGEAEHAREAPQAALDDWLGAWPVSPDGEQAGEHHRLVRPARTLRTRLDA